MKSNNKHTNLSIVAALLGMIGAQWTPESVTAQTANVDGQQLDAARQTTTGLLNSLVAAVVDLTLGTTEENVATQSLAVSLLVPEGHSAYSLIDGTGSPIDPLNSPKGQVEREAMARVLNGEVVEQIRGDSLRTFVPLPNALPNCALCHANYAEFEPGVIVGAISIEVPLR